MIFLENRLLADDSHEISYLIYVYMYVLKLGKMLQNLSSAAVVIGAFRVKVIKVATECCTNLPRETIGGGFNCLSKGGTQQYC